MATGTMKFKRDEATIGFGNQWLADSGLTIGIDEYEDTRVIQRSISDRS